MKNKSGKKNPVLSTVLLWIVALLSLAAVCLYALWHFYTNPVSRNAEDLVVEKIRVPEGSSVRSVAESLEEKKLIRSADVFYYAARFNLYDLKSNFNLKSGVYTVKSSMPMKEIYFLLQSGEQEYISVSIPEGLTMRKIANILADKGVCTYEDFMASCQNTDLLAEYKVPSENFEGYLFPDTYFFTPDMSGEAVVRTLVETFFKRIQTLPVENPPLSPEKLHEIVTLASIVEREYRVESEAPLIASVFTNRIKRNIGLYSCATIEYIITEIQGKSHPERITYEDLKIDSPYNTYKWAGLTPGPISNPGLVALNAAANPAKTNYYFFVLTDPATGSHTFSSNFDQHRAAENLNYVSKGRK